MAHIFISYSRRDQLWAERIRFMLEEADLDVWLDMQIAAGEDWSQTVMRVIQDASAVVVLISEHSNQSEWVQREIMYAREHGVPLIPVLIESTRLPLVLVDYQYIDATRDLPTAVDQLIMALGAVAGPAMKAAPLRQATAAPKAGRKVAPAAPPADRVASAPVRARGRRWRLWLLVGIPVLVIGVVALLAVLGPSIGGVSETGDSVGSANKSSPTALAIVQTRIAPSATLHRTATPTPPPTVTALPTRTLPPTGTPTSFDTPSVHATATAMVMMLTQSLPGQGDIATGVAVARLPGVMEMEVETRVADRVAATVIALRVTDESSLSLAEAGEIAALIAEATAGSSGANNDATLLVALNVGALVLVLFLGGVLIVSRGNARPFRRSVHGRAHAEPEDAPPPPLQAYQVFVSSSDADKEWVGRFVRDLSDLGYLVWWYAKDAPGLPFGQEIVSAVFYTKVFVVVVSPDSMKSKHVEEEIRLADRHDRPIITVVHRPTDQRLYGLAKSSDIDFSDEREYKGAMEYLTGAINTFLERHRQAAQGGVLSDGAGDHQQDKQATDE